MNQLTTITCVLAVWGLLSVVVGMATARVVRNRDRQQPRRETEAEVR